MAFRDELGAQVERNAQLTDENEALRKKVAALEAHVAPEAPAPAASSERTSSALLIAGTIALLICGFGYVLVRTSAGPHTVLLEIPTQPVPVVAAPSQEKVDTTLATIATSEPLRAPLAGAAAVPWLLSETGTVWRASTPFVHDLVSEPTGLGANARAGTLVADTPENTRGAKPMVEAWVVGAGGRAAHRTGGSWKLEALPSPRELVSIAGNAQEVYALADDGTLLHRSAGSWRIEESPSTQKLLVIAELGGTFVVAGEAGAMLVRKDDAWQKPPIFARPTTWRRARRHADQLIFLGDDGAFLLFGNGQWTTRTVQGAGTLIDLAPGITGVIALDGRALYYSDPTSHWKVSPIPAHGLALTEGLLASVITTGGEVQRIQKSLAP